MQTLTQDFDRGVQLLADNELNPAFPQEALDIVDFNDQATLRRVITRECFGGNANDIAAVRTDLIVARNQCAGQAEGTARMISSATHATTSRQLSAVISTINAMKSAKGLKQSAGLMVNYLYDLQKVEAHHEKFVQGEVAPDEATNRQANFVVPMATIANLEV